jgi:cytochrome c oxidase subunit 2
MKMDAVPGIPTTMWFTPKYTTREMKAKYGDDFNYEISCDQMCGPGHYGMRGVIVVESEGEFKVWLAQKQSQYAIAHSEQPPANRSSSPADSTSNSKPTALLNK